MSMLQAGFRKTLRGNKLRPFELDVEFSVADGVTVLFGPSGSGKTTVLQCLAGLMRPDSGVIRAGEEVFFDDRRKVHLSPERRRVGYVFQDLALFPHMTAAENTGFGIQSGRERRERLVGEILERFHIGHLAGHRPDEISGGERQRVALARALVTRPHLLLLDEPFSALDDELKTAIMADLKEWLEQNRVPVLLVTHDRSEAGLLGDRTLLMKDGSIVPQAGS